MNRRQFAGLGFSSILGVLFLRNTKVPLEPRVWLATDRHGKPDVLHMTGGTFENPLTLGDMDDAAWEQLPRADYMKWKTASHRWIRYSPDGSGH